MNNGNNGLDIIALATLALVAYGDNLNYKNLKSNESSEQSSDKLITAVCNMEKQNDKIIKLLEDINSKL